MNKQIIFSENYHIFEVLFSFSFLKELLELIKLILWRSNNQTYHLDCWEILRFSRCGVSILRSLGFHLVRCGVKAQTILSTRSWGSKPSLLLGFITIVDGVHIIWYQSFGSKISLTIFHFLFFIYILLPLLEKNIIKKKGVHDSIPEKKKNINKKKKSIVLPLVIILLCFQSC